MKKIITIIVFFFITITFFAQRGPSPLTDEKQILSAGVPLADIVETSMNSNGQFVVAWEREAAYQVQFQTFNNTGEPNSWIVSIPMDSNSSHNYLGGVVIRSNGEIVIAVVSKADNIFDPQFKVLGYRYSFNGVLLGSFPISIHPQGSGNDVEIAVNENDDVVFSYIGYSYTTGVPLVSNYIRNKILFANNNLSASVEIAGVHNIDTYQLYIESVKYSSNKIVMMRGHRNIPQGTDTVFYTECDPLIGTSTFTTSLNQGNNVRGSDDALAMSSSGDNIMMSFRGASSLNQYAHFYQNSNCSNYVYPSYTPPLNNDTRMGAVGVNNNNESVAVWKSDNNNEVTGQFFDGCNPTGCSFNIGTSDFSTINDQHRRMSISLTDDYLITAWRESNNRIKYRLYKIIDEPSSLTEYSFHNTTKLESCDGNNDGRITIKIPYANIPSSIDWYAGEINPSNLLPVVGNGNTTTPGEIGGWNNPDVGIRFDGIKNLPPGVYYAVLTFPNGCTKILDYIIDDCEPCLSTNASLEMSLDPFAAIGTYFPQNNNDINAIKTWRLYSNNGTCCENFLINESVPSTSNNYYFSLLDYDGAHTYYLELEIYSEELDCLESKYVLIYPGYRIENQEITSIKLNISPNPAINTINIELLNYPIDENFTINIVNIFGIKVGNYKINSKELKNLDISKFSSGLYNIILFNDKNTIVDTFKFIKK